jgi:nucleoside-diphosphate-sugar epimerase
MSGADWVIHAAADLDLTGPSERMRKVNVEGSDNVASLAYKLGVGRFLSVSSMAYFGGSPDDGVPVDETARPLVPFPTLYSETKHQGERVIQEWAKKGLKINTVYPSLVYGPPGKKDGANSILRSIYLGRFPIMIEGDRKTSWIFLDDVVEAMVKIMEKAPPGRDYLLTGEVATLRQVMERVHALGGAKPPKVNVSAGMARVLLASALLFYRLLGRRPPVPLEQLRSIERHWAFDDARAQAELDWQPRGLAEGLPPTVEMIKAG